jgi:uncharacterized membrane protein
LINVKRAIIHILEFKCFFEEYFGLLQRKEIKEKYVSVPISNYLESKEETYEVNVEDPFIILLHKVLVYIHGISSYRAKQIQDIHKPIANRTLVEKTVYDHRATLRYTFYGMVGALSVILGPLITRGLLNKFVSVFLQSENDEATRNIFLYNCMDYMNMVGTDIGLSKYRRIINVFFLFCFIASSLIVQHSQIICRSRYWRTRKSYLKYAFIVYFDSFL